MKKIMIFKNFFFEENQTNHIEQKNARYRDLKILTYRLNINKNMKFI